MATWTRRTTVLALAAALAICGLATPARAQQPESYYGRTVADVRFEVDGKPDTSPALVTLVDVHAGRPLAQDDVRSSMDRLFSLGRYDDIRPTVADSPAGVIVTFRLVGRYPITRIDVLPGDTGVPPGTLNDELRQRFSGVLSGIRVETVEDAVRALLEDAGYLDADVSATTVVDRDAGRARLAVTVHAGPLATIHAATVEGTSPFSEAEVLRRVHAEAGQPFRQRDFDADLSAIEDDLRGRGYYEAQATLDHTDTPQGVDVVIRVDAGPRVELRVEPADALPGRLDDLVPVKREHSADRDLLEDAQRAIVRALTQDGYADAEVSFRQDLAPDSSRLVITFTIVRGNRYFVDHVELPSALALPADVLNGLIKVRPGDVYDPDAVTTSIAAVVNEYRRRGYYRVIAKPDREIVSARSRPGQTWVVVHPNITEGPRGVVSAVTFSFTGGHQAGEDELRRQMRSSAGAPYVSYDVAQDQGALLSWFRERGYLSASVGITPEMSADGATVALDVGVVEGPQVIVRRITVIGNEHVSEARILEAVRPSLAVDRPLAASAIAGARQELVTLNQFSQIVIGEESRLSGETDAHIVISVVESPNLTVGFGGGLEGKSVTVLNDGIAEDHVDLAPRGSFEIARRNLGGHSSSLDFFSRVSLTRKDRVNSDPGVPDTAFTEYRVSLSYREQRAFHSSTELLGAVASEQAIRTTYKFLRRTANAEVLHRVNPHVSISGRSALEFTRLFDERIDINDQPLIDRLFPQVRLFYFSGGLSFDTRDDTLSATRGRFLTADADLASRTLGSQIGYVKSFFQASNFTRIGSGPRTVFAMRGEVGFARGFERTVTTVDPDGTTHTDVVSDLPISQRFFAGGSTTVRGFQIDRLGVYDPACMTTAPGCAGVIDPVTGLSLGGNSVIVLNGELRRALTGRISAVGFLDGGNVFARAGDFDLARIRGAAGFGVRADSPLGAIRLDFGFKLSRRTIAGQRESGWEYHLSIGEAF